MIKKFEIKSHDGPGRIGKIDGEPTPRIFFKRGNYISYGIYFQFIKINEAF